jgi:hypothetical protein
MFVGRDIWAVVDLLHRRQASLWHACQLADLLAYLALGGVPARSLVERKGLPQTAFITDAVDRRNGVWDKVFCNLDDFGRSFAIGRRAVPNPYGPIVLQIRPEALTDATDVALALRSAGAHDFDRDAESLSTIEEVDRIYRYPAGDEFPRSAETLFGDELQNAFNHERAEARAAELSISVPGQLLPLTHVSMLLVEPFDIGGMALVRLVEALVRRSRFDIAVRQRQMYERKDVWSDLVRLLSDGPRPLGLLRHRADSLPVTRTWMFAVHEQQLAWQFDRFAQYLYTGTLKPMHRLSSTTDMHPNPTESSAGLRQVSLD